MDRQIVYPGAVPLETDLLNTNKFAMIGLAKLASAVLGSDTCLVGLQCTSTTPASMQVKVSAGEIYCLQMIDDQAYSTLPADHSDTILKQGITPGDTLIVTPPEQPGTSHDYIIQVAYQDADTGGTVLPFYNAADPSMAFSGPGNNGEAQPGVRAGKCILSLKKGKPSTSGTQVTPEADTGYVAIWVITVSDKTTAITPENIKRAPGAPFIPSSGVYRSIQQGNVTFAHDAGSANAYAASYEPPLSSLVDGMRLTFKAREANTGKSTFSVRPGEVLPLLCQAKKNLEGGEIAGGGIIEVEWCSNAHAWLLSGNVGGAFPVPEALKPGHALNLGQADERYLKKGQGYSEKQAKKTFLPLAGGEVTGTLEVKKDLNVSGMITTENGLKIGKAKDKEIQTEINAAGDIFGQQWNGNLSSLLERLKFKHDQNFGKQWWLKQPLSGLLIQGGEVSRQGEVTDVHFPVAYTAASAITVLVSLRNKEGKSINNYTVSRATFLGFKITAGHGESDFSWIAIGC